MNDWDELRARITKTLLKHEFAVTATCVRCKASRAGVLTLNQDLQVADSLGFMVFDEGVVCDECLESLS